MTTDPSKTSMKIVTSDLKHVLDHFKNGKSTLYKTTFNQGSSTSLPIGAANEEEQNTDETVKLKANTESFQV